MSKNEQVVLLHHPCHYEELVKKLGDPMRPFDTEFEEWTFMDDPKYLMDPMKELLAELNEKMRVSKSKRQIQLLCLTDDLDKAIATVAPRTIQTIHLPDDLTEKLESVWSDGH